MIATHVCVCKQWACIQNA